MKIKNFSKFINESNIYGFNYGDLDTKKLYHAIADLLDDVDQVGYYSINTMTNTLLNIIGSDDDLLDYNVLEIGNEYDTYYLYINMDYKFRVINGKSITDLDFDVDENTINMDLLKSKLLEYLENNETNPLYAETEQYLMRTFHNKDNVSKFLEWFKNKHNIG